MYMYRCKTFTVPGWNMYKRRKQTMYMYMYLHVMVLSCYNVSRSVSNNKHLVYQHNLLIQSKTNINYDK